MDINSVLLILSVGLAIVSGYIIFFLIPKKR